MTNSSRPIVRRADRVHDRIEMGPNAQSDERALIIPLGDPSSTDPFLVMGEEKFSSPGFDWHPHRGVETVTIVLDGLLEHGDNLGNAGVLEPGDVQWMTAGRGIIHRELAVRREYAHIIQLWVNLPAERKLVATRYQDLRAGTHAVHTEPGVTVQVISGQTNEVTGPAVNQWPIFGAMLTFDPRTGYRQVLPSDERIFAYVVAGPVAIGGRVVRTGQIAWFDPIPGRSVPSTLPFATPDGDGQAKVMVFAGRPIGEPVVARGPFVGNSYAEIERAYRDLRAGRLGGVPRGTQVPG
ncbi:pirin family protein [Micromonospora sp. NPDC050276]|uniref:pirin family protein n=1 Tax=Micromonospora sp. NPDC050276 TaxID=3364278 RepID=UPI0037A25A5B